MHEIEEADDFNGMSIRHCALYPVFGTGVDRQHQAGDL